ncbi:lysine--tRNA ligase [Candidatus Saccharibacteria bacterium]|nr:lysine--tRNA ligase [Candidatus Saccharibacteria bacterium]MBB1531999.1 lysine--tRNA ligase [Candidatus Saccharibacteria bacterium]
MTTISDYRDERLRKLAELKELGINPYPAHSNRNTKISDILEHFDQYDQKTVIIAGRIVAIRSFGKLAFVKLRDYFGEVQLFMKQEGEVTEGLISVKNLKLLDLGDFIEAEGMVGKSQTGEISIFTNAVRLLTKSLRPLPGRDGFTNKEERYRRRYVDMNVNPEVRERLVRRSIFWQATRDFMNQHGFIEINTPILEHTTGGADATPFVTHMDALDEDFYLRISQELPLKRLLGAGFEKVYDIGPRFRNEGVDDEHLPEHIAFESYSAFEDYNDGMNFYEEMIKYVAKRTWGTLKFNVGGFEIDLDQKWPRIKYADLIKQHFDIDVFQPDRTKIEQILKSNGVEIKPNQSTPRLIDNLWKLIRKKSGGPFWLIEEPLSLSPLAKISPENPLVTERFHPIIAGTEMGNGYSELNDPLDQLARFEEQQSMRDQGDSEAQMLDTDFVEMLEYGMPPACGWGNSERNFWLLEGVSGREAVPFPIIKRKTDN